MFDIVSDSENQLSEESLEFCANVEKHLKRSGAVNRFLANIVFVGLPGSGKSTLIARLLNLKGVDDMLRASGSTGIMDGIITVDVAEDEATMHAANIGRNFEWHKVEFRLSCLRQMGQQSFVIQLATEDQANANQPSAEATDSEDAPASERMNNQTPKKSHGRGQESYHLDKAEAMLTAEAKEIVVKQIPAEQTVVVKKTMKQAPLSVMEAIQKEISTNGFSAVRPFLDNKSSLYLSDTGEHFCN